VRWILTAFEAFEAFEAAEGRGERKIKKPEAVWTRFGPNQFSQRSKGERGQHKVRHKGKEARREASKTRQRRG